MKNGMIVLFVFTLLTAGCTLGRTEEPEPAVPTPSSPITVTGKVIAEAVIEPLQWSELRFQGGGTVAEITVEPGDLVEAGDVVARLDPTAAELRVREAEAALASAEASLALVEAEPRSQALAEAEAELERAKAAVAQAIAQRDQVASGTTEAAIADAKADVAAAEVALFEAKENHRQVHEDSDDVDDLEQADYKLFAAEGALAAAQAELDALQKTAGAKLRQAESAVQVALAQQDVAEAQLELLEASTAPWDTAAAEANVGQARVALASAEAALAQTVLRAPFAGTVTKVNIEVGDLVTEGHVIAVLAMLDELRARTTDLSELAVAAVAEGQPATVRVDAQPDQVFTGVVRHIALRPREHRGDVVYAVDVDLTNAEPAPLRWGMTAVVEIEVD